MSTFDGIPIEDVQRALDYQGIWLWNALDSFEGYYGIEISEGGNVVVEDCTIYENAEYGFLIPALPCECKIYGNYISPARLHQRSYGTAGACESRPA